MSSRRALSVRAAADDSPAATALVSEGRELDWSQLEHLVGARVDELRAHLGAAPVDGSGPLALRFALVGKPDFDTVVTLLSFLELGEPVVLLHPRSATEHGRQLEGLGAPGLWQPSFDARARVGARAARAGLKHRGRTAHEGLGAPEPSVNDEGDERLAAVLFTSGSSGVPKAVALSRRALVQSAKASRLRLGSSTDDRWLLSLSPAHVGGLSIVTRALFDRATIVLAEEAAFDARKLVGQLRDDRVTMLSLVPTMLQRVVDSGLEAPSSLRAVLVGGAHAPEPLVAAARNLGWPVRATYGLTEACSQVATQGQESESSGCGRPLDGLEVRIADDREIELRGDALFSGYVVRGERGELGLDRSAFDEEGWFATGDQGNLRQGELRVLGRRDDRIVTGGENVAPAEVEQALRSHASVRDCCVVGIEDLEWGERIGAVLVGDGDRASIEELHRHLGDRLARFKFPRRVLWVEALPETASGKVDREACRRLVSREHDRPR